MYNYLFPFAWYSKKLEKNRWHRLSKVIYIFLMLSIACGSIIYWVNKNDSDKPIFQNIKFWIFTRGYSDYFWFTDEATIYQIEMGKKWYTSEAISEKITWIPKSVDEIWDYNLRNNQDYALFHLWKYQFKYRFFYLIYLVQIFIIYLLVLLILSYLLQIIYYKVVLYVTYGNDRIE